MQNTNDDIKDKIVNILESRGLRVLNISTSRASTGAEDVVTSVKFALHFADLNNSPNIDVEGLINQYFPEYNCRMKDTSPFNKFSMALKMDNPTKNILNNIAHLGNLDPKCDYSLVLKLMEEVGELSECFNHLKGNLPHKTMKEKIEGEAADVIICAIAVIARVYSDLKPEEVIQLIMTQLALKSEKWSNVINIHIADREAEAEAKIISG